MPSIVCPFSGAPDVRSVMEAGSVCSNNSAKRGNDSSHSSNCVVDTTTKGEELAGWRGECSAERAHCMDGEH